MGSAEGTYRGVGSAARLVSDFPSDDKRRVLSERRWICGLSATDQPVLPPARPEWSEAMMGQPRLALI